MKPVVLILSGCYLPGVHGGGPIRTISNLVEKLGDEFDFRVITMDRDFGDLSPYKDIKINTWCQVGKALVFYTSSEYRTLAGFSRLIANTAHDVLYLNSFFSPNFTLLPMLSRRLGLVRLTPVIVAPRGEFSRGALGIKRWKKIPYVNLVMMLGLFKNVIWQASSEYERSDIESVIRKYSSDPVCVAENLTVNDCSHLEADDQPMIAEGGLDELPVPFRICFLSRIAPMKNLDYVLKVLASVKATVSLSIYGPKESLSYWNECESLINSLPKNITVSYGGSVDNKFVRSVIAKHDLFFVPSRGENFGHVFIEALSAGVPILVSDKTPWRFLTEKNIGWDVSLESMNEFSRIIDMVAGFDKEMRSQMRSACISYAHDRTENAVTLEMNRSLFKVAINSWTGSQKNEDL